MYLMHGKKVCTDWLGGIFPEPVGVLHITWHTQPSTDAFQSLIDQPLIFDRYRSVLFCRFGANTAIAAT